MRRLLIAVEVALYLAFMIDCVLLAASVTQSQSWEPIAGPSLIVLLLAASGIRSLREKLAARNARKVHARQVDVREIHVRQIDGR